MGAVFYLIFFGLAALFSILALLFLLLSKTAGRSILYFWGFMASTSSLLVLLGAESLGFLELLFTLFCLYFFYMFSKKGQSLFGEPLEWVESAGYGIAIGLLFAIPLFFTLQDGRLPFEGAKEQTYPLVYLFSFLALQLLLVLGGVRMEKDRRRQSGKKEKNRTEEGESPSFSKDNQSKGI